jgi:hypothetical protein
MNGELRMVMKIDLTVYKNVTGKICKSVATAS